MKLSRIALWHFFISTGFLTACNNTSTNALLIDSGVSITTNNTPSRDSFPAQTIIKNVVCKNDASQSYALYIPNNNKSNAIIYFFDPHADGALPLKNYKTLADKYGFILIGSNNSKNGNDWPTTENVWQQLFTDTQSRLSFDRNRIYTCGFSGGAKVASYIALHQNEVKGVIANGAGLPDGTTPSNYNFSFTAVTGEGDMNMTDLVATNNALDQTQTKHRIIFFNGKHEWAPLNTMQIAFESFLFDAMRNNILPKNDSLFNAYIDESKKRLNENLIVKNFISAERECKLSINMLNGLTTTEWFATKEKEIVNATTYKDQQQQQQKLFSVEENKKQEYNNQFQQGDLNYWTKTISDLKIKSKGSTLEAAMYQRLLAYLSLAFYSISNQLISNNQNKEAAYFVQLYKLADATNSEAWYFSAILNARNSNAKAAENDLIEAVQNGFNDAQRMMHQPEFMNLQAQINFNNIEMKMKNN